MDSLFILVESRAALVEERVLKFLSMSEGGAPHQDSILQLEIIKEMEVAFEKLMSEEGANGRAIAESLSTMEEFQGLLSRLMKEMTISKNGRHVIGIANSFFHEKNFIRGLSIIGHLASGVRAQYMARVGGLAVIGLA